MGKNKNEMILIKWINNKSKDYDGKEHFIAKKFIIEKNVTVGDHVHVKWSGKKVWNGVVRSENTGSENESGTGKQARDEAKNTVETETKKEKNQTRKEKLTGKEKAAKLTGKEKASKLTGKEKVAKLTGKEKVAKLTGKEKAAKLTGKEKEKKSTGKGKKVQLTSKKEKGTVSFKYFLFFIFEG